jgi:hypothetical protein
VTPFQNRYLEPACRKIRSADEAVVPATDDQRIGLRGWSSHANSPERESVAFKRLIMQLLSELAAVR